MYYKIGDFTTFICLYSLISHPFLPFISVHQILHLPQTAMSLLFFNLSGCPPSKPPVCHFSPSTKNPTQYVLIYSICLEGSWH